PEYNGILKMVRVDLSEFIVFSLHSLCSPLTFCFLHDPDLYLSMRRAESSVLSSVSPSETRLTSCGNLQQHHIVVIQGIIAVSSVEIRFLQVCSSAALSSFFSLEKERSWFNADVFVVGFEV
ncbi:uncharacterized, partial [Tachysurus ichikawai]